MAARRVLILGCGYTGRRVGQKLLDAGVEVVGTATTTAAQLPPGIVWQTLDIRDAQAVRAISRWIDVETAVLYSIPSVGDEDRTRAVLEQLGPVQRLVYLSTTGVYGEQQDVDENTAPAPNGARGWLRLEAEQAVRSCAPNGLILRPAAIYGPFRGIQAAMRAGTFRLAAQDDRFISRIHVDDLADHCVAALHSSITGAWPVADEHPCTSAEMAAFCAEQLGVPLPPIVDATALPETRRANRRVDGSAIRRELDLRLRFPSYREGIPACIAAEAVDEAARAF